MKAILIKRLILLGIIVLIANSCTSNLDFNQVNTLKLEPVVVSNLASFEIQAGQFNIGGVEQSTLGAVSNFDVFADPNFANHILKAEFNFEIDNAINRDFTIEVDLLDASDRFLYKLTIGVQANTTPTFYYTELFQGANLRLLLQTRKIAFRINLTPGTPALTSSSPGSLKLRSGVTAYLKN